MLHGDLSFKVRSNAVVLVATLLGLAALASASCSGDSFFSKGPRDPGDGGESAGGEAGFGNESGVAGTSSGGRGSGGTSGRSGSGGEGGEEAGRGGTGGTGARGGNAGSQTGGASSGAGAGGSASGGAGSGGGAGMRNCVVNTTATICTCRDDTGQSGGGGGGGVETTSDACIAACDGIVRDLVHRYRFDGLGSTAEDSVGNADGTVMNTALAGAGALVLAGGESDQYVDLPNGIASSLTNATFEAWVTWSGGSYWQRIFDFGTTEAAPEGTRELGKNYLMLTPQSMVSSTMRLTFQLDALTAQFVVDAPQALPIGVVSHVAAVIDDEHDTMVLYRDGVPQGCADFPAHLSSLNDVNAWFGRSQWLLDPALGGVLHEVRIYEAALTPTQVRTSFSAGPDPAFLAR